MNTCDKDMVLVACPPKINYNNYNVVCMYCISVTKKLWKTFLCYMQANYYGLFGSAYIWLYCTQKINFLDYIQHHQLIGIHS